MNSDDIWYECIADAFDEAGIEATPEQIEMVAAWAQNTHENWGLSQPSPESPYPGRIKELERELERERTKVTCDECGGRGYRYEGIGTFFVSSRCDKCRGEGRIATK